MLSLRTGGKGRCFADMFHSLFRGGEIRERFADMPPAFPSVNLHEHSRVERDISPVHATTGVHYSVGANDSSTGIAQDGELAVYNLVPHHAPLLAVINADRHQAGVERLKLFCMPRELAQLGGAVGSPIAAIEDQQDALAVL